MPGNKNRSVRKTSRALLPVIERMEHRTLLSAVLGGDGTLTVNGTGAADTIRVEIVRSGDGTLAGGDSVAVTVNSGVTQLFAPNDVKGIVINGGGGADSIAVDISDENFNQIPETINAGDGNDTVTIDGFVQIGPTVVVNCGAGNDSVTLNYDGDSTLNGGDGNDTLEASANVGEPVCHMFGDNGNDTLHSISAGAGGNLLAIMSGGNGNDTFINDDTDNRINVTGGPGIDTIQLGEGSQGIIALDGLDHGSNTIAHTDVENVVGTPFGEVDIIGNASNNLIDVGSDSPITILGGGGNDTITAGGDTNYVDGGTGNDLITCNSTQPGNTLIGGDGNDTLSDGSDGGTAIEMGGNGDDTFIAIINSHVTVIGGAGSDTLRVSSPEGSSIAVDLRAGGGASGPGPSVSLPAGDVENADVEANSSAGSVNVTGNSVANKIIVNGAVNAWVTVNAGDGNDTVNVGDAVQTTINGGAGNDSLTAGPVVSDELAFLSGGDGNDTLVVNGVAGDHATLLGGNGNDILKGGNEVDLMDGGAGADQFSGGGGTDIADYHTRTANLVVWLDGSHPSGQSGENDHFDGTVEIVYGGSGNDYLVGTTGKNALYGNGGNDSLFGGGGVDAFFGGSGNDQIHAKDGDKDYVDGGPGNDFAQTDLIDTVVNVETITH